MTQLKGTQAALEDREAHGGKAPANSRGWRWAQRELQERREMFRKELSNKSCQSNRRFSKDPDGFRQRLRELWEARAPERPGKKKGRRW